MDLDNSWFENDFADDIFETLLQQELSLPRFTKESPYINRSDLIKWILELSEEIYVDYRRDGKQIGQRKYIFDERTIHLAVYLFDFYIDRCNPSLERTILAGATSLIIAAKFEEESTGTSNIARSICALIPSVTTSQFREMEESILNAVDFRLTVPTAITFVPYFIAVSDARRESGLRIVGDHGYCTRSSKTFKKKQSINEYFYMPEHFTNSQHRRTRLSKCAYFDSFVHDLCGFSLKGSAYRQFKPSKIAASSLAAARFCIGANPTWPSSIETLSKYNLADLLDCVQFLLCDLDCERRQNPLLFPQFENQGEFATAWHLAIKANYNLSIPSPISSPAKPVYPTVDLSEPIPPMPVSPTTTVVSYSNDHQMIDQISNTAYVPAYLIIEYGLGGEPIRYLLPANCDVDSIFASPTDRLPSPVVVSKDDAGVRAKRMKMTKEEK